MFTNRAAEIDMMDCG